MEIDFNDFVGIDHGTHKIDFKELAVNKFAVEMRPIQLHYKSNGALDDKPSFAIVFAYPTHPTLVYGQVSLQMLEKALDQIGYTLVPKEKTKYNGKG